MILTKSKKMAQAQNSITNAESVDDWFTPRRFAILLGLLFIACFPMTVLGLNAFAFLDAGQFAYPVAFYNRESFWRGELPLWNPLNSCGIPFMAQWSTLTLYPPSLFYLLLPLPWSLNIFCLGHLFVGGMGMYFLAFRWTGNRLAAAVAGVGLAFNGLTWFGLMWPSLTTVFAWMPWVVLTMERAWREGGQALVAGSLTGAMQLLTGGAEVIIQTWLLLAAFWLVQFFRGEIPRKRLVLCAAGSACLAAGLASAQLFPFLDLLAHSQRDSSYSSSAMGGIAAMPITGMANYLLPLFHCFRTSQGAFVQPGQNWTYSYYLGVGVIALALFAIYRVRDWRVRLLTVLTLLSLSLAPGGMLLDWLKNVLPVFGFMRFPVKFTFLATFTLPLLAAHGLNRLYAIPAQYWRQESKHIIGLTAGLIGVIGVLVFLVWKFPSTKGEFTFVAPNAFVRVLFLTAIIACILYLRRPHAPERRRSFQICVIGLLWFDIYTHSSNLSPTTPAATLAPDRIRHFFQWDTTLTPGVSRALQSRDSLWRMLYTAAGNSEGDIIARRLSLFMNLNLLDHAAKFDGFYSMDLKEYLDVYKQIYFKTNEAIPLKTFLGISRVSNRTNLVDWTTHPASALVTGGQSPVFLDAKKTLGEILSASFEPSRKVYLPLDAQDKIHAREQTKIEITSSQSSSHLLEFTTRADAPAMVVIAQTFYHPWQAYVDRSPVQLWRANYAFQALEVPQGEHIVSVAYQDKSFHAGLFVSLLSLGVCGLTWFKHRPNQPA